MKKKGDRQVPNCVPVEEVKTGPEITGKDLLFKAAAMAMRDASHEGISLDYEQAIKQASKIYGIPYQPSELPRLLAQRAEIDRQLALLKQGKQVAKQRRQAKLAPTPAGADEYWKTHALPTDRIKPATKSLEETEAELAEDLKKWFKEKWVRFGPDGKIRGDCARGSSKEGKPKCLPQSKAHALGKKGRASSAAKKRREDPNPERRGPAKNVATKVKEDDMDEGWKQNMAAGILGATMALSPVPARAEIANMSPVQVQQSIKRAELTKKYTEVLIQRAKEDGRPLDTRTMNAIKAKASDMATKQLQSQSSTQQQTPQSNFPKQGSERIVSPDFNKFESKQELDEKQDACYHKVKSRYKVWPSAYASGALVQCRKKGAANWGTGAKKK
jgi:hypothetical protein